MFLGMIKLRKMQPTPKLSPVQKLDSISHQIDMPIEASASGSLALASDLEEQYALVY
jgi:hypothetical protein